MRFSRNAVGAVLAVTVTMTTGPVATAAPNAADTRTEIRGQLTAMVAAGVPGVSVHVADGPTTWRAAAGVADVDTGAPMPADGQFRAASLTKSMVATVVLQLAAEGRLGLADRLGDLLPGAVPGGEQITVTQLLNHTSGLSDYLEGLGDIDDYTRRTYSPDRLVAMANERGHDQPGRKFAYSNTNYVLLGMIVERRTGHDLGSELRRRVFEPAGMNHSYFPTTFPFLAERHASGYYQLSAGARTELTELNPSFAWAAYGAVSTPSDVQRFYQALLGGRLLPAGLLDQMRTPVATPNEIWPRYGLGLEQMATTCGIELWGHTGSIPGYSTFAFATRDGTHRITLSTTLFSPKDGSMFLGALNAINLEFCGTPMFPAGGSRPTVLSGIR